ncbi:MAG: hypothetical protein NVSMB30_23390 [Hymenobacter sp.]
MTASGVSTPAQSEGLATDPLSLTMYRHYFFGLLALLFGGALRGYGQAGPSRVSAARTDSVIVAKAFPLLSLFETHPALRRTLRANKALQRLARHQAARTYHAFRQGPAEARRYADSLVWQPREIKTIGQSLLQTYLTNPALRAAVAPLLGTAGRYPLYAARPDTTALRLAWQDAALGLNHILRVYLAGEAPRNPAIDSSSFRRHDPAFAQQVRELLLPLSHRARHRPEAAYTLPLQAALLALRLNGRDEAARYEPLRAGLNQAPCAAVAHMAWARYPYTLILVPGRGPDEPAVALDSMGAFRCRLAAARYRQGQAPFILVSGGHVHPNKTPYCEAVEMKAYLTQQLGVPAAAVLVEPYARHTTTNLRNAARMLYEFGLPTDRPLLIVTDPSQSRAIVEMAARCRHDLGYVPYRDLRPLSPEENTCFPVPEARQPDPTDTLDP